MSDLKKIDDIFKNGAKKHYPVDENLWAKASGQLDAVYPVKRAKKGWIYLSIALLSIITVIYGISKIENNNTEIVQTNTNSQTNNTTSSQNGQNNETSSVANNSSIKEQSVNPNPGSPISNDGIAETNDDI